MKEQRKYLDKIIEIIIPPGSDVRVGAFNILALCGILVSFVTGFYNLFSDFGILSFLECMAGVVVSVALMVYTHKTGNYRWAMIITVAVVFIGLFTFLFISNGGYESGIPYFFVFAIVFTAFLLDGKIMFILVTIEMVWYAFLCFYTYYNPLENNPVSDGMDFVMDVVVCETLVSAILALAMYFQMRLYRKKQSDLMDGENIVSLDMDEDYCVSVIGLGKTGKTNLIKAIALEAKDKGDEIILFDGKEKELKDFAKSNKIAKYITSDEELFNVMQDEIVGAFGERNKIVNEARNAGNSIADAMKDQKRIVILINDYASFIETVYSEEYGMDGFFEAALDKGRYHKINFIAAMTNDDVADSARFMVSRQFTSMESGVNLGGMFDQQNVLHWEMSSADAVRQLAPGFGYALMDNGAPVKILTPLV